MAPPSVSVTLQHVVDLPGLVGVRRVDSGGAQPAQAEVHPLTDQRGVQLRRAEDHGEPQAVRAAEQSSTTLHIDPVTLMNAEPEWNLR